MNNTDHIRNQIKWAYIACIGLYLFPYNILLILWFDSMTFELIDIFLLGPFLLSLLPSSLIGCVLNVYGLIRSYQINDHKKKENGLNNLLIGGINVVLGILGLGLLYSMV